MTRFSAPTTTSKSLPRRSQPYRYSKSTDDLARWLDNVIAPNVYAVVHLGQPHPSVFGNRKAYEKAACDFMTRLSKAIYGEKAFRRRPHGKKLIPNFVTLEMEEKRPHLNILMRRPDYIDFGSFRGLVEALWLESPWAEIEDADKSAQRKFMRGAFWCEERRADRNPVGYSLKEGTEALLERSLSF